MKNPVTSTGTGRPRQTRQTDSQRQRLSAIREIVIQVFRDPEFQILSLSSAEKPRRRLRIRPVSVREGRRYAFETLQGNSSATEVLSTVNARRRLFSLLRSFVGDVHLATVSTSVHARVTHSGRWLVSRKHGAPSVPRTAATASYEPEHRHDRVKKQPLHEFDSARLLHQLELTNEQGVPHTAMGAKIRQINAFIAIIRTLFSQKMPTQPLYLVDCGCGKAYLTFGLCAWIREVMHWDVRVMGVDREAARIESCRKVAAALDMDSFMHFETMAVDQFQPPETPHMVLSLHACDTATDDALGLGVRVGARWILAVPCCQHTLHESIVPENHLRGLMRYAILRRRFGDLLTDACRAQLLRIAGYRTVIQEFVSPEFTDRNLLIRAERGLRAGRPETVEEYRALKACLTSPPPLETVLRPWIGDRLDLSE